MNLIKLTFQYSSLLNLGQKQQQKHFACNLQICIGTNQMSRKMQIAQPAIKTEGIIKYQHISLQIIE